jgi:hypothetical protein
MWGAMAEQPNDATLYAAMLAAAAGVVTTSLTLLVGWLQTRNAASRRLKEIEEAHKRVSFLEEWHRTRLAVAPNESEESRSLVLAELDAAMERVKNLQSSTASSPAAIEREAYVARLSWYRRWFLLYMPGRPLAWLPRVFFYLSFLPPWGWLQGERWTYKTYGFWFPGLFDAISWCSLLGIELLVLWFARWLAISAEKKPFVSGHPALAGACQGCFWCSSCASSLFVNHQRNFR